ncbi:C45 family autoproteolytic acyltransferase/hydolase [Alkalihalobacillus deserti]|uniref:C45 family autoproteolytic acyltransferase/hydolase n=1 Tax=Alkalihalobacillus deserti TaxID=2879466 RepID=UPI001D13A2B4|nr:C45 family peptidase [Alkalihalobacillus deserti]
MQRFTVPIHRVCGTYSEIGFKQGEQLRNSSLATFYKKRLKQSVRAYQADINETKAILQTYKQDLWDELIGLAEGLEWSFTDVIQEFSGFQSNWKKSGCSAIMTNGIYIRNYDYSPKTYEGRLVFTKPNTGFASVAFSQRIFGRIDGMNEHGLTIGYHFVNRIRPGRGFICTTINRLILELCKSTEEAVSLLRELPHRHSFNYSIYDRHSDAAVVEASPTQTAVHRSEQLLCSNHFSHSSMHSFNRKHLEHSLNREGLMHPFLNQSPSLLEGYQWLNDRKHKIFQTDYSNYAGTIHTVAFEPTHLTCLIGLGTTNRPHFFSLQDWIDGKPIRIKKMLGVIETDIPFPYSP